MSLRGVVDEEQPGQAPGSPCNSCKGMGWVVQQENHAASSIPARRERRTDQHLAGLGTEFWPDGHVQFFWPHGPTSFCYSLHVIFFLESKGGYPGTCLAGHCAGLRKCVTSVSLSQMAGQCITLVSSNGTEYLWLVLTSCERIPFRKIFLTRFQCVMSEILTVHVEQRFPSNVLAEVPRHKQGYHRAKRVPCKEKQHPEQVVVFVLICYVAWRDDLETPFS